LIADELEAMGEREKAKGEKRKADNYADAFFFVF
jgi:hypothetical protein